MDWSRSRVPLPAFAAFACCLLVMMLGGSVVPVEASHEIYPELQSVSVTNIKKVHRTGYHFQPPKHWINDPNGPMVYKGIYHLFYQYNPKGAVWGNIIWAHSVSRDLVNWKALEPAIYPSKHFDIGGCWSGSATILPGDRPVILYTGLDKDAIEMQNYAIPSDLTDPYLRHWTKPDDNPLIYPTEGINASAFRDPTTAWFSGGYWKTVIGSRHRRRGIAHLYRSKDFLHWVKAKHPLHSVPNTGNWECPDFFPVLKEGKNGLDTSSLGENVRHILKVSLDETRYEYYTIGTYDPKMDKYIPDNTSADGWDGLRLDYGNFYASKTFFDSNKNRRILWGWANESDPKENDTAKGWSGIQTIPRTMWLDSNGKQLMHWPIEEIEMLRGNKVELGKTTLKKGEHVEVKGITAAQADVEVVFSFSDLNVAEKFNPSWGAAHTICAQKGSNVPGGVGPFGIMTLATEDFYEYTPVFFRIFKVKNNMHKVVLCSDARPSSYAPGLYKPAFAGFVDVNVTNGKLSLRSLIDNSVVESFGAGGKTCITSRVYPQKAIYDNAHLFAFNNGMAVITVEKLTAWSMKNANRNVRGRI
ncbi:beta-fructofuranosidase, insoluble isoenzyme 1 [Punica granatum]|uniref:Beta-fructofuranosidase, insoluble isoenzyme 1 n=1 Tax=Punica granatum TaxID=22663 RepID=A0A6P8DZA0_PUNGR|nr:beta-fructofuranosidase, insoluble isoenzyme 1 [Punica granatum]